MGPASVVQKHLPRKGVSHPGPNKACRCRPPGSSPTIQKRVHPCRFQSRWARRPSELQVAVRHLQALNSATRHRPSLFPNRQIIGWMLIVAVALVLHGRMSSRLSTILCFMTGSQHSWKQSSMFVSNHSHVTIDLTSLHDLHSGLVDLPFALIFTCAVFSYWFLIFDSLQNCCIVRIMLLSNPHCTVQL